MSLEQVILDRLEKRNAQIAQLQGTIQALERAADAEREHARQQLAPLIEENKKLAARIDDSEVIERRERLIKSLNDEITKRDNELREIDSASKAHREALQAKEDEIQEWLAQLERARQERDAALLEVAKLRAEVPLESTREALKNAVAKLQEVTTERDQEASDAATARADAQRLGDECARLAGKVAELEAQKPDAQLRIRYESLLTKNTDLGSYAMTLGRKEGEPLEMFMERQALRLAALESQAGTIGYSAKAEHEAAVTAARENGIHKGESLSGFIWRQCESLRKSQAENAPLSKVFTAICKQRGNLNEEIIYRAVDEASDAIKKLTA